MNAELFKDLGAVARAGHCVPPTAPHGHNLQASDFTLFSDDRRVQVVAGIERSWRSPPRWLRRRPTTGRSAAPLSRRRPSDLPRVVAIRCAKTSSTPVSGCSSSTTSTPATTTRCGTSAICRLRAGSGPSRTKRCSVLTSAMIRQPANGDGWLRLHGVVRPAVEQRMWGVIQHINEEPSRRLLGLRVGRFERCRR